jgi:creatinine amidohydrolase/Fe(II)-dependent formamide hydrolase-like protein
MRALLSILGLSMAVVSLTAGAASSSVYIEELTWTEVRDALQAGKTTVIIPVGGTEQNGPHMALGKHNARVRALAGRIAETLGTALVAPVVAYVPEGGVTPPTGHMRYAGTISVPDVAFRSVLEGAARSFKQHGFVDVVLIGDSGNYQAQLKTVAGRLNHEWATSTTRAHFVGEYYRATEMDYPKLLRASGLSDIQIGKHAGAADTSLLMAVDPRLVRPEQLEAAANGGTVGGASGDPRPSSAELGQMGIDLIVAQTVAAIQSAQKAPRQ